MPCGLLISIANVAIYWPLTNNKKILRWKK